MAQRINLTIEPFNALDPLQTLSLSRLRLQKADDIPLVDLYIHTTVRRRFARQPESTKPVILITQEKAGQGHFILSRSSIYE